MNIWREVTSFIFLVCFTFVSAKIQIENGLYQETDRVRIFKDMTFRNWRISELKTNWLIEYYHSACGHCINFAPIFKKFASDVQDWRDTVQIGVIDCLEYHEHCREEVRYYPTIMFYRRGGNTSAGVEVDARDETNLKITLLKQMKSERILQPIEEKDLLMLPDDTIVIADAGGIVAQQVILDLRHHNRPLKWVKGKYVEGHIKAVENSTKDPVTLLEVNEGRIQVLKMNVLSRATARRVIEAKWNVDDDSVKLKKLPKSVNKDSLQKAANSYMKNKFPHFEDIHSSLILALRQDVSIHKVIDGEKLSALKNMLSVIREYLSYLSSYARSSYRPTFNIIATMYTLLENKLKNLLVISGSAWKEMFDATILLPKSQDWVCCIGSKPYYRGYPCGLWTLFHSLTVMDCLKDPTVAGKNSQFLARTVKNFVVNFFSCHECAENFAKETKTLETDIESTCDSMLWLWRIHNKVNKRLADKPSEDPLYPKIQFPPSSLCPSCRRTDKEDIQPEQWNEEEVKRFVTIFFEPRNLRMTAKSKILSFAANYTINGHYANPSATVSRYDRYEDFRANRMQIRHSDPQLKVSRLKVNRQSMDFVLCGLISVATTSVAFYIFMMFYRKHYRHRNSSQKFIKRMP